MSFEDLYLSLNWAELKEQIYNTTHAQVELALKRRAQGKIEDLAALLSPVASEYLEPMAQLAHSMTKERFGKTIQLYAPLYISNLCSNVCTYCGFSANNKIPRKILSEEEMRNEAKSLKKSGIDHVLLVTGESESKAGVDFIAKSLKCMRDYFSSLSIEVQPLEQAQYESLIESGLSSVYLYQETYSSESYAKYHLKGHKKDFFYRLQAPEKLGQAGIKKLGLGVLYGLEDWRTDSFFAGLHLNYLEKHFWKTRYSLSFPRLRPHEGGYLPEHIPNDRDLAQTICAFRIFNKEVELALSTRESAALRTAMLPLGITSMSAGSKTNPGGYSEEHEESLEQFAISDERSPAEVAYGSNPWVMTQFGRIGILPMTLKIELKLRYLPVYLSLRKF